MLRFLLNNLHTLVGTFFLVDNAVENYLALNELKSRVETDDDTHLFEIIAVPSNIFGKQVISEIVKQSWKNIH